jgi:hypothetical protein
VPRCHLADCKSQILTCFRAGWPAAVRPVASLPLTSSGAVNSGSCNLSGFHACGWSGLRYFARCRIPTCGRNTVPIFRAVSQHSMASAPKTTVKTLVSRRAVGTRVQVLRAWRFCNKCGLSHCIPMFWYLHTVTGN